LSEGLLLTNFSYVNRDIKAKKKLCNTYVVI